jgi:hypothetical protein
VTFITTGSVPQFGSAAAGGSVGAAVAGAAVAGAAVAGATVAGATVVAGAPQEESNMDVKTSKLAKEHNTDFLFISYSPL